MNEAEDTQTHILREIPPFSPLAELGPEERALVRPVSPEKLTADDFFARTEAHRTLRRRPKTRLAREAFDALTARIKAYADFNEKSTEEKEATPEAERPTEVPHEEQVEFVKGQLFGLFTETDLLYLRRAEAKRQRRAEKRITLRGV